MARLKLSEFQAKTILYAALQQEYAGVSLHKPMPDWAKAIDSLPGDAPYVVKVDQAVKGRFKQGLVLLDQSKKQLQAAAQSLFDKGYDWLLIDPQQPHEPAAERYLAIERNREGLQFSFAELGGVDIEAHADTIVTVQWDMVTALPETPFPTATVARLVQAFQDQYFSFLEINPLLIERKRLHILDAAVEVDAEADFFAPGWTAADLRRPPASKPQPQVEAVRALDAESQASFALEVINPDGAIFLLLSGGGASVVIADEVSNLGYGSQLANYGEYSGNPNAEETAHYTKQVLELLLNSKAPKKVLLIGGGVANFTDIRQTFKGVIQAIDAHATALAKQDVAIFVRRGGPHEKDGLRALDEYLTSKAIRHEVHGPEIILTDVVSQALKELT